MDKLVFFHKTPAIWNKAKDLSDEPKKIDLAKLKKKLPSFSLHSEMNDFFSTDVYVHMCKEICAHLGINELHIVHGYREDEPRNWSVMDSQGWCHVDENTTYWSLTDPENLLPFMESGLIFSRGNYPQLHNWLSTHSNDPSNQFWLHYPATSIRFPHLVKYRKEIERMIKSSGHSESTDSTLTGMAIEHNLTYLSSTSGEQWTELLHHFQNQRTASMAGPYSMVLADDRFNVSALSEIFSSSMVQTFIKPAVYSSQEILHSKEYDLIYCGTTLQTTKNHQCFIQLLKHIDALISDDLTVAIAGNKKGSPLFENLFSYPFSNIRLVNMGELPRSELQVIFSKTKTMIVTSGRDANPRIIQECLVQGCRVLAVDTLSDGQEFIESNPLLGTILPSNTEKWTYERNGNLVFHPSVKIASMIVEEIKKSNFPDLVATIARKKLSVEQSVLPLISTITSFR